MAQRKRILFVITKSNFGGAQRYVYDLATSLSKDEYAVTVACGGSGPLVSKLIEARIRTIPLPIHNEASLGALLKTIRELFALFQKEKPDIVHLNSSLVGVAGTAAARLARVPKVFFTAHGWAFNEDRSLFEKTALKILYAFTILFSDKTIAVSEAMKRQANFFPLLKKKMTVIHNGVRPEHILPRDEALRALGQESEALRSALEDRVPVIGTIAELHPIKGLPFLLEAASRMRSANRRFVIIIMGEGIERKKLEGAVHEKHLEETVFLLGHIDNAPRYLAAFDIFVLPSLSEGLGYVILEAGLVPLPIVASNVGGLPEIIKNGGNGILVPPRSVEKIVESLSLLLDDTSLRHALSSEMKKTVETRFSLPRMVEETRALYA